MPEIRRLGCRSADELPRIRHFSDNTQQVFLELVKKNIMNAIPAPKVSKPKIEIFKREELQAISDVLKTNSTYRRYYLLFLLTINTGMRLGEVLGLKRKCVFDDYVVINNSLQDINGKMVDTPPKTAAGEREITITRDLSSDLKKRFNSGKIVSFDGYIFQSKNGTPLDLTKSKEPGKVFYY